MIKSAAQILWLSILSLPLLSPIAAQAQPKAPMPMVWVASSPLKAQILKALRQEFPQLQFSQQQAGAQIRISVRKPAENYLLTLHDRQNQQLAHRSLARTQVARTTVLLMEDLLAAPERWQPRTPLPSVQEGGGQTIQNYPLPRTSSVSAPRRVAPGPVWKLTAGLQLFAGARLESQARGIEQQVWEWGPSLGLNYQKERLTLGMRLGATLCCGAESDTLRIETNHYWLSGQVSYQLWRFVHLRADVGLSLLRAQAQVVAFAGPGLIQTEWQPQLLLQAGPELVFDELPLPLSLFLGGLLISPDQSISAPAPYSDSPEAENYRADLLGLFLGLELGWTLF